MKNAFVYTLILVASLGSSFVSADQSVKKELNIAISDVFVPDVITSSADAKIVLNGIFPNSCYTWSRADVTNSSDTFHEVRAMASVTTNMMCLMVLVPYNREVNLGKLIQGTHTLRFVSGDDTFFERTVVVQ